MKILPIGMQSLAKIRYKNAIYVDKTKLIYELVTGGAIYFLSRPRRFGKSLVISVLKELYLGNKSLFEDLWIYDKWDWSKTSPVIHISFDETNYDDAGLDEAISFELKEHADKYGIELSATHYKMQFKELLKKLNAKHGKVVLLIDEYDKPIIDYLEKEGMETALKNQKVMKQFYSVLKNSDDLMELIFITGVSKFSKVSLFSDLNNPSDITLNKKYSTLCGYTQEELEFYFDAYLIQISEKLNLTREALLEHIKVWYNGYSWDGINRVYNPFGTLNFLDNEEFQNFWFATGSPNFLIKQMKIQTIFNVENVSVNTTQLEKYNIENITLIPLLFQTGYLTVKEKNTMTGDMILDYPNKEVRESMYQFLIDDLSYNPHRTHTGMTIKDLQQALVSKNLAKARDIINALLAALPYEAYKNQSEGFYHGLLHLIFSYLGMFIQSEPHLSHGRADVIVETLTDVFIFEFKFNKTAQEAITQIKNNAYADKYRILDKPITGIGVNFNEKKRKIDEWLEEIL
ncbi:MAG: AAA family ATPase [Saprospiraceae bacterium]|nr:AAA family ATPase [Saprospiraceae bacterium]